MTGTVIAINSDKQCIIKIKSSKGKAYALEADYEQGLRRGDEVEFRLTKKMRHGCYRAYKVIKIKKGSL